MENKGKTKREWTRNTNRVRSNSSERKGGFSTVVMVRWRCSYTGGGEGVTPNYPGKLEVRERASKQYPKRFGLRQSSYSSHYTD